MTSHTSAAARRPLALAQGGVDPLALEHLVERLGACGIGCSAKKPCTSATTCRSVEQRHRVDHAHDRVVGNAALASAQCWRTKLHAAAPWWRLAMHMRSRNGAFWVLTSPLSASSHVRSDQRLVVELGERVQVAQLVLRRGGRCGSRRAAARSRRRRRWRRPRSVAAATSSGSTCRVAPRPRRTARGSAPGWRRRRRARPSAPTSRPRSLPRGRPRRRPGRRARRRPGATSAATRAWNARVRRRRRAAGRGRAGRARSPATRRARARRRSPRRTRGSRRRRGARRRPRSTRRRRGCSARASSSAASASPVSRARSSSS